LAQRHEHQRNVKAGDIHMSVVQETMPAPLVALSLLSETGNKRFPAGQVDLLAT